MLKPDAFYQLPVVKTEEPDAEYVNEDDQPHLITTTTPNDHCYFSDRPLLDEWEQRGCCTSSGSSRENTTAQYVDDVSPWSSPHSSSSQLSRTRSRSRMQELALRRHLISRQNPNDSGDLMLSSEEIRTLVQEGWPIPTKLPLSDVEEHFLKIVRRKIKNKLSAQESRRKKKIYVDDLELRLRNYERENAEMREQIKSLVAKNTELNIEMRELMSRSADARKLFTSPDPDTDGARSVALLMMVCLFVIPMFSWVSVHVPTTNLAKLLRTADAEPALFQPSIPSYVPWMAESSNECFLRYYHSSMGLDDRNFRNNGSLPNFSRYSEADGPKPLFNASLTSSCTLSFDYYYMYGIDLNELHDRSEMCNVFVGD